MISLNKTSNQSLAFNAAMLTTSKILSLFISLATSMLLSRFRTLEEFGTFSQIQIIVTFALMFFVMGLPNSINYFYPKANTQKEKDEFLFTYYFSCTLIALLAGLVLFIAKSIFASFFANEQINIYGYLLLILPWTNILISSISNTLIVGNKIWRLTFYNICYGLFLLIIIVSIKFINGSFELYLKTYLTIQVIFALWVYYEVLSLNSNFTYLLNLKLFKDIIEFTFPIGLAGLIGTLNIEIGKILIGHFMGTEMLAIYSNAARELPLTVIAASITAVLMPHLVNLVKQNRIDDLINLWGETIELSYIILCFFSSVLFVFAPQIITFLYSEKYLPGLGPFRVYSLVLIWRVTYFGMILNITKNSKFIFYISILTLISNILLILIFYNIMGFIGPSIATFISIGVTNILQLYISAKVLNKKFITILPWGKIGKITLLNIFIGIFMYIIVNIFKLNVTNDDLIITFILGCLWGVIYFIIKQKRIRSIWFIINNEKPFY